MTETREGLCYKWKPFKREKCLVIKDIEVLLCCCFSSSLLLKDLAAVDNGRSLLGRLY